MKQLSAYFLSGSTFISNLISVSRCLIMVSPAYLMCDDSSFVKGSHKGESIAHQHGHHAMHAHHADSLSLEDGARALHLPDSAVKPIAICALQLAAFAMHKLSIAVSQNGYVGCSVTDINTKTMFMTEAIASVNLVLYLHFL